MRIRGIAWEGGGILGLAYLRPLQALDASLPGGLRSIEVCAGTSAGAITAMLVALGADGERLEHLATSAPYHEFADDSWGVLRDTWRVLRTGGWHRLDAARDWLGETIVALGHPVELTFGDLARQGRELHVAAVNETRGGVEVLGPRTAPEVTVLDGVLASMAIPLFWPPVEIGEHLYSDGGLVNNHPIDVLERRGLEPHEVLGFALDSKGKPGPERAVWPLPRAKRLVSILIAAARRAHVPERYWPRICRIDCGALRATDFGLTAAQRSWLLDSGERAWNDWQREAAA